MFIDFFQDERFVRANVLFVWCLTLLSKTDTLSGGLKHRLIYIVFHSKCEYKFLLLLQLEMKTECKSEWKKHAKQIWIRILFLSSSNQLLNFIYWAYAYLRFLGRNEPLSFCAVPKRVCKGSSETLGGITFLFDSGYMRKWM